MIIVSGVLVVVERCLKLNAVNLEAGCIMIIVSTVEYAEENSRQGKH